MTSISQNRSPCLLCSRFDDTVLCGTPLTDPSTAYLPVKRLEPSKRSNHTDHMLPLSKELTKTYPLVVEEFAITNRPGPFPLETLLGIIVFREEPEGIQTLSNLFDEDCMCIKQEMII